MKFIHMCTQKNATGTKDLKLTQIRTF